MTRAEWDQWQHERAQVEALLGPIETDTRTQVDHARLYRLTPGADLTAAEITLALIGQLRRALTRTATNPRTAAHLALLVGLRTGDRVRKTLVREANTVKARKAAKAPRPNARRQAPIYAREVEAAMARGIEKATAIANAARRHEKTSGAVREALRRLEQRRLRNRRRAKQKHAR
ncbi:MAG: hypothetical protein IT177_11675 [Acidobacteria bacterium]|nr:hypothetical protein [Acidobacteriota bacterium]